MKNQNITYFGGDARILTSIAPVDNISITVIIKNILTTSTITCYEYIEDTLNNNYTNITLDEIIGKVSKNNIKCIIIR